MQTGSSLLLCTKNTRKTQNSFCTGHFLVQYCVVSRQDPDVNNFRYFIVRMNMVAEVNGPQSEVPTKQTEELTTTSSTNNGPVE